MELTESRARRWLLLDRSALVRCPKIDGAYGEPCLCAITRLEMLYSARSAGAYEELETADELHRRAGEVRAAAKSAGRSVGLLFDLQGPKLRLSAHTPTRPLRPGEKVVFTGGDAAPGGDRVHVDFPDFPRLVTERSEIVIGDGVPRLTVESLGPGEVVARAVSAGELAPRKGINVTYARPELPAITEKDTADLALPPSSEQTSSPCHSSARRPISKSFGRGWPRTIGMAG